MLTLLRGKARKSVYFEILFNGTNNGIFVQYGQDVNINIETDLFVFPRQEITRNNEFELEIELNELLAQVLTSGHQHLFLYANFTPEEVEVLKRVMSISHTLLPVTVSVQDDTVPDGQLIIEEIRNL